MGGADGLDQAPDLARTEHVGQRLAGRDAQMVQRLPVARECLAIEEPDAVEGDAE